jgi:hypothetical protein
MKLPELLANFSSGLPLAWIAKSRQKQCKHPLEIARFGNLAEPKGNFPGFSGRRPGGCSRRWEQVLLGALNAIQGLMELKRKS